MSVNAIPTFSEDGLPDGSSSSISADETHALDREREKLRHKIVHVDNHRLECSIPRDGNYELVVKASDIHVFLDEEIVGGYGDKENGS